MRTLEQLKSWVRWLMTGKEKSDTLYLGHHSNVRAVGERRKYIRFPVCLAIQYKDGLPIVCEDFAINMSRGGVFVETETPFPEGSELTLHFYIPPEKKLLAEFKGEVIAINTVADTTPGMHILLHGWSAKGLQILEDYLDERRHLLDQVG